MLLRSESGLEDVQSVKIGIGIRQDQVHPYECRVSSAHKRDYSQMAVHELHDQLSSM
jgi:hypothetical protein